MAYLGPLAISTQRRVLSDQVQNKAEMALASNSRVW